MHWCSICVCCQMQIFINVLHCLNNIQAVSPISQWMTSKMTPFSRKSVILRNMCSSSTTTLSSGMLNSGCALQPGSLCQFTLRTRFTWWKNEIGSLRSFLLKNNQSASPTVSHACYWHSCADIHWNKELRLVIKTSTPDARILTHCSFHSHAYKKKLCINLTKWSICQKTPENSIKLVC